MPYIRKEERPSKDEVIRKMVEKNVKADGDLNYILFKFAKYHINPSYNNYKNFIGELNETIAEIRRELLAPYEDIKKEENGSI